MNPKICLGLALLLAAITATFLGSDARAQQDTLLPLPAPPSTATRPAGRGAPAVPANLTSAMNAMGRAFRALKSEALDPAKAEAALRDIGLLQRDSAVSKAGIPFVVDRLTGEERTRELAAYRAQMIDLMRTLLDLEEAVMSQKTDEIKKLLAKLDEAEAKGHKQFE